VGAQERVSGLDGYELETGEPIDDFLTELLMDGQDAGEVAELRAIA
jgi:hypothetical protein